MPLDIGVSALFLQPGKVGGAEFMLKNLIDGLNAVRPPTDRLWIFGNSNADWSVKGPQEGLHRRDGWGNGNRFIQGWRMGRRTADEMDALLFPNYFTPPIRTARQARLVTVVHDLQYLHFPRHFTPQKRLWLRLAHELTLRQADRVIAISTFVKEDLLARYGAHWESKIQVIPNPISFERFAGPACEAEPGRITEADLQRGRYILSVAAQYPHKNLATLIQAFAQLRRRKGFNDVRLILAGQLGHRLIGTVPGDDLRRVVNALNLEDAVLITGYVSDADLGRLYRHATVFAFPSLFEGFGMPAVEALGFGLPVITTRCGALPEVTLGLAHYVEDPWSAPEWAASLAEILARPGIYRLAANEVAEVRGRYHPDEIGRMYYSALVGASTPIPRRMAARPATASPGIQARQLRVHPTPGINQPSS